MAGGAQPAGTDLGEAAEDVPSLNAAVHASAAQPGTDPHFHPEAQIDSRQRLTEAAEASQAKGCNAEQKWLGEKKHF